MNSLLHGIALSRSSLHDHSRTRTLAQGELQSSVGACHTDLPASMNPWARAGQCRSTLTLHRAGRNNPTSCNGVMHVTTRGHTSGPACAWTAAKVNAHTARKQKRPIHLRAAHLRGLALRSPTPNATLARAMHARERAVVAASASDRKHEQAQCVKTLRAHPLR